MSFNPSFTPSARPTFKNVSAESIPMEIVATLRELVLPALILKTKGLSRDKQKAYVSHIVIAAEKELDALIKKYKAHAGDLISLEEKDTMRWHMLVTTLELNKHKDAKWVEILTLSL